MDKNQTNEQRAHDIYWDALDAIESGLDVNELADQIIETNCANYIMAFARDVEGAPKEKLINAAKKLDKRAYQDFHWDVM